MAVSPDGRTAITDDLFGTLRSWNLAADRLSPIELRASGRAMFRPIAISPDGRTVAARADNGTVRLLVAATGRTLRTLTSPAAPRAQLPTSFAFAPDGRTLAVSGVHGTASLWDLRSGKLRATFAAGTSPLASVTFSPDGRTLATASADSSLRLWDIATGQDRATFDTGRAYAASMAFSPDGHILAVGTGVATFTYNVPLPRPTAAITTVCAAVDRAPTPQETAVYRLDTTLPPACPRHNVQGSERQ
ncbi:hypothetical protein OG900_06600 [Streptomyces sp. NBC_00433]